MSTDSSDPKIDELSLQVHHRLVEKLAAENKRLNTLKEKLTENSQALEQRYALQELLTEISTELMQRSSSDTDEAIEDTLGKIGGFTGADRSVIIILSPENRSMDCTHEWCAQGIAPHKEKLQGLPLETFPWWMEKVQRFEHIHVKNLENMPPEAIKERVLLESLQVKSAVALPMGEQGKFIGFIGLSWIETKMTFDPELIPNLQMSSNILFGALHRAHAEKERAKLLQTETESNAKSSFLARMSHELRTPLNAIIVYSEMLTEDAKDAGLKDLQADLEKIHGAGQFLLELINDILDLSKVEAGKMDLVIDTFTLDEVVNEVISITSPLIERNNNRLTVEKLYSEKWQLASDRTKLRQILFNLLGNAAKFTTEGTINLKILQSEENSSDTVILEVKDNGIGMSEEQLQKIFKPFDQANAEISKEYGGTGLGLAITKSFVEMMKGKIEIQSKEKWGSHFIVALPAMLKKDESIESAS